MSWRHRWILTMALAMAAVRASADSPDAGYTRPPETPRDAAAASPSAAPALRLSGPDWAAAGAAEGVVPRADLAGDPNKPIVRSKLSPADEYSFFNTREWQDIATPKNVRGRAGALQQLKGAGEGMSLNLAADQLDKLVTGH